MHTGYLIKCSHMKTKQVEYTISSEPTPTTVDRNEYDILIDKVTASDFDEAHKILYNKYKNDYPIDKGYVSEDYMHIPKPDETNSCIIL